MPHAEEHSEFTPDQYPPFPDSPEFPTIDLETISLKKLQDGDGAEQERVFGACKNWGFFYLELPDSEQGQIIANGANDIARVAEKTFQLPLEEKLKYEYNATKKTLFGYKRVGRTMTDKNKTPDTAEFFNVGKNQTLESNPEWPSTIEENKTLFRTYCSTAHSIGLHILDTLAQKLNIDPEEIHKRHTFEQQAGDHVRMTRGPPRKSIEMPEIQTPSHTDFGTITVLMNWLGGLQVYATPNRMVGNLEYSNNATGTSSPEASWLWVRPKKNCAIINLGDAAVKFTHGTLCSGRHRVVPAPGSQGQFPRYSIVYFVRPIDECKLKNLLPDGEDSGDDEGINAKEWIFKQSERLAKGV